MRVELKARKKKPTQGRRNKSQNFTAVRHGEDRNFFVLVDCPSNKHNYHQNSRCVLRLLKANGSTQISNSDKSPLIS